MTARTILTDLCVDDIIIDDALVLFRSLILAEVEKLPNLCGGQVSRKDLLKIIEESFK